MTVGDRNGGARPEWQWEVGMTGLESELVGVEAPREAGTDADDEAHDVGESLPEESSPPGGTAVDDHSVLTHGRAAAAIFHEVCGASGGGVHLPPADNRSQ